MTQTNTADGGPRPSRWHDPALLEHLVRVRKPWDALVRRVVRAVLAEYLPGSVGLVVEIGAGGGQLRDWLPLALLPFTAHTEPSEPFLAVLRGRYPDAAAVRADATGLPFDSGSVSAVLGLCVLDTLPDLGAVRTELARVLRPGGVVIHFLDLSTNPDALFAELIAGGELPLTNFVADSGLVDVLPESKRSLLPVADEFDDILVVGWEAFTRFVGMLKAAGHPLVADLGPYARLTEPGRLDPDRLAQEFMAARGDPESLRKLNRALLSVTLTARGFGREWPIRAVSSRDHLRDRLRRTFGPEDGFEVGFAGPMLASEVAPPDAEPNGVRLVLRHAGRTVTRQELGRLPGVPVEELDCAAATPPHGVVRATTVEVFVARKLAPGPVECE